MGNRMLGVVFSVAVLFPSMGTAQIFVRPNPYPDVNASRAAWYFRGDPIFHAGAFYYPTGPSVYFDSDVMMRTGTYEGIPLYEDSTIEPYSIIYVPIGGNVMRPYERRREGYLAGTIGSRTPSFPVQRDGEVLLTAPYGATNLLLPPVTVGEPIVLPEPAPLTAPAPDLTPLVPIVPLPPLPAVAAQRSRAPVILDVWVSYEGARWSSAGPAVANDPDRFVRVGEYHGSPVYRLKTGRTDVIYIPSVSDGPLAPYRRTK